MKALSLTQPWATLVIIGAKRIETRSLPSHHRGPLAIHASAGFPGWAKECCRDEPFRSALAAAGYHSAAQLPRGCVLGVVEMDGSFRFTERFDPGEPERSFGDFADGRYGYRLSNPRRLAEPIPAKGMLGLWAWEEPANLDELLGGVSVVEHNLFG